MLGAMTLLRTFLLAVAFLTSLASAAPLKARVGIVFDLTGTWQDALDVVHGIEIAAQELKGEGVEIKLEKYDSKSDALGTKRAMEEALKSPPDFLIAEVQSSKAEVAAAMAESAKRFLISPEATSPLVTQGRKYVFRACFDDEVQGRKLADFAIRHLKAKTGVVFFDAGQLASVTMAESFHKAFTRLGGKLLIEEKILGEAASFRTQLAKVAELKPDVMFLPIYEKTAKRFVSDIVAVKLRGTTLLGGDSWGPAPFHGMAFDTKAVPVYWVSHTPGKLKGKSAARFEAAAKKYHRDSLMDIVLGYDTMRLVGEILKKTGEKPSQETILATLHAMKPFAGLSGPISFPGDRQTPDKDLFLFTLTGDGGGAPVEYTP